MKTKIIKIILVMFCWTFILTNAKAQMVFNAGGNLGSVDYLGGNAPDHAFHPGLGLRAQLCLNEKNSVLLGFQYNFHGSQSYPVQIPTGYTTDTLGGYPVQVPTISNSTETIKTHIWNIYLHEIHDFIGENDQDFSFYGYAGIGIMHYGVSISYDPALDNSAAAQASTSGSNYATSASTIGFTIDFGVGVDIPIQNFFLFGELGLDLAANSANGEEIDQSIPHMFDVKAGIRYPFGSK